jgi:cystathionine beta-lyase
LRYAEQARSALVVAEWLEGRAEVAQVLYPPMSGAPGHDLWARDYTGAASILAVVMKGGCEAAAHALMGAVELFGLGYSWGGFESLMTHETGQLAFRRDKPALAGELMRLHVGLEDPADLIADLERGLSAWRAAIR